MTLISPFLFPLAATAIPSSSPQIVAQRLAADYQSTVQTQGFSHLASLLASDFTYIDAKGRKTSRAVFLRKLGGLYRGMAMQTFRVDASSAKKVPGGVLFVENTKAIGVSTLGGPKANFYSADARDEVLAVYRAGRWLVKRVRSEKLTSTMNGKPFRAI